MGMYTEIYVKAQLEENTPSNIIEVICGMIDNKEESKPLNEKPSAWGYMFKFGMFDDGLLIAGGEIKNYQKEIEQFFDFIKPWCENDFIGYYLKEDEKEPTLVFSKDEKEPTSVFPYDRNITIYD